MGWRPEERSSSDVGQWTTLLRRLLGHFAISTTSVECYGLSHACFYLRLSSNVTTRVWIDNLYHIKPGKYHGVGTLTSLATNILRPPRQICPQNALDIIRAVLAGGWTSRSLASHTFILSFSFHGSQKTEVPGYVFSVCVQPGAQHVGIVCELALADSTADV